MSQPINQPEEATMAIALKCRSRNVPLRRRIEIRLQTFARTLTKAAFWMRNGHSPVSAWRKAVATL